MLLNVLPIGPGLLVFEVMDKEPPSARRAILYCVLAVAGFLLAQKRWWFGIAVLPVVALFAWADVSQSRDPFVTRRTPSPESARRTLSHWRLLPYVPNVVSGSGHLRK